MSQTGTVDRAETQARRGDDAGVPAWLRWAGGLLALLVAVIVVVFLLFDWDWLRGPIGRYASARLHREVRITGHLKVHLLTWQPTATAGGLRIANADWAKAEGFGTGDLADVDQLTVSVDLPRLLRGQLLIPLVQLERPRLDLARDAQGRANWNFGPPTEKPTKLPPITRFIIDDGQLRMRDVKRKLTLTGTVNTQEKAGGPSAHAFSLKGNGSLNAHPFALNVAGGPLINVRPNQPYPFDLDVRMGETHVIAKGDIPKPFDLGVLGARVQASGPDLADLYYLTGVALPNSPPYSASGRLERRGTRFEATDFTGRVGASDLEGRFSVDTKGGRKFVDATLRSRALDLKDLLAVTGAKPRDVRPKGAPPPKRAAQPPAGRLLPDAPLYADRVRSMDARLRYTAESVKASPNLPLREAAVKLTLDHGLLTLDPIRFDFPQGSLSGTMRLNARPETPVTDVDLRVTNVAIEQFLPANLKTAIEGRLLARAQLKGVGDSVHRAASTADGAITLVVPGGHIRKTFAELLGIDAARALVLLLSKDQADTPVRCAVASFKVVNGQAQLQQAIMDTGVVTATAKGGLNLRTEALDLQIQARPKSFRLVRLNAPITLEGPLAHPHVGVKAGGAIAQAGIGTALAALATPLAAVLPFVDAGLAKDANCAGLESAAKAGSAPVKALKPSEPPPSRKR